MVLIWQLFESHPASLGDRLPSRAWNHRCVQNCTFAVSAHTNDNAPPSSGQEITCIFVDGTHLPIRFIALIPLLWHLLDPKSAGQCLQGADLPQLPHRPQLTALPLGKKGRNSKDMLVTVSSTRGTSVGPQLCPKVFVDAPPVADVCFCSVFDSLLFSCLPFSLCCLYCPSSLLPTEHSIFCLLH